MNTPQEDQDLATALMREGFPALSTDEEALLVNYLSGAASVEERQAAEALVESYPKLGSIVKRIQGEAESGDANLETLVERLISIAKRQRRERAFGQAWERLQGLARQIGEGMDLEDFQLADFELAGAMLGGGGKGALFEEELVTPLAGHTWTRTGFTVHIPDGAANAEFEVLNAEGETLASRTDLNSGRSHEFTFEELGMSQGNQYEWSLTFTTPEADDHTQSGMIIRSAPVKQTTLNKLIGAASVKANPLAQGLLECVVLYHHDVYDALLNKLRDLYELSQAGVERHQVLMMSQRSYRKLRQFLSKSGFPQDSDRILELIAAVEHELDESVLQQAA